MAPRYTDTADDGRISLPDGSSASARRYLYGGGTRWLCLADDDFRQFLRHRYLDDESAAGDLARDAWADPHWPGGSGPLKLYEAHLRSAGACRQAIVTLRGRGRPTCTSWPQGQPPAPEQPEARRGSASAGSQEVLDMSNIGDGGLNGLLPFHLDQLHRSSISDEVIAARGYSSVSRPTPGDQRPRDLLKRLGIPPWARREDARFPGLLIPMYRATGEQIAWQYRPDNPPKDMKTGKHKKYASQVGHASVIDVHPRWRDAIIDPSVPRCGPVGAERRADHSHDAHASGMGDSDHRERLALGPEPAGARQETSPDCRGNFTDLKVRQPGHRSAPQP